jgi:hypothetical protein
MTLKEKVKATIETLPSLDDDTLVYYYKCSLGRSADYKPLIKAIELERKSRNKSIKELDDESTISTGTSET